MVIIAGESEAPSQSQRSIFDSHRCNYTKKTYRFWSVGLGRLRRIKIGGVFVKSHYVGTPQILLLLLLLLSDYMKITLLTDTKSPFTRVTCLEIFIDLFFLVFSSLLVSAVMFHASVSEQTPDTPVSLAICLVQRTNLGWQLRQKSNQIKSNHWFIVS